MIAMKPRYEGEARHAILAAMACNLHPKWVIAVDPDIDIRNSAEVEWAQSFRVKPSEDVFVVDRTATAPLDPYTDGGFSSSVGIDATKPFGVEFPESRKSRAGASSTFRRSRPARSRRSHMNDCSRSFYAFASMADPCSA